MVKCPRCNGTGKIEPYPNYHRADKRGVQYVDPNNPTIDKCPTCNGSGNLHERSAIKYQIGQAERELTPKEANAVIQRIKPESFNAKQKKVAKLYDELATFDRTGRVAASAPATESAGSEGE